MLNETKEIESLTNMMSEVVVVVDSNNINNENTIINSENSTTTTGSTATSTNSSELGHDTDGDNKVDAADTSRTEMTGGQLHIEEEIMLHDESTSAADCALQHQQSSTSFRKSKKRGSLRHQPNHHHPVNELAKYETRDVRVFQITVGVFMVLSAVAIWLTIYFNTRNAEEKNFEQQFVKDAQKVHEAIVSNIETSLGEIDSFATTIVSEARSTNQSWPFVTIDDFAVRAARVRSLSANMMVNFNILVEPGLREKYEKYTSQHDDWVNETLKMQATDKTYYGPLTQNTTYDPIIRLFGDSGTLPKNDSIRYLPTWQTYPCVMRVSPPYSWDYLSTAYPGNSIAALDQGLAAVSPPYLIADPNDPDSDATNLYYADWYSDFIAPTDNSYEPISEITYPIIDDLSAIQLNVSSETQGKVVGTLSMSFYWREVIRDILPSGKSGMIVVFDHGCSVAPFTYEVSGPTTTYLGSGDHHISKYDFIGVHYDFYGFRNDTSKRDTYLGVPLLVDDYCPFTIHLYPSVEMRESYNTTNPVVYTTVSILILFMSIILFCTYNYRVEKRQRIVLDSANQSNAVLTSLFPSKIHEQLLNQNHDLTVEGNVTERFKSYINSDDYRKSESEEGLNFLLTKPIADLYPETTVLFCDIKGFTAWSSERNPSQVFKLLETLYGAFDAAARKRNVFKVETVGDSYVAVGGLPEPLPNHAVVMVRFADDIIQCMSELSIPLSKHLGPETKNLCLRVGLNSGPTTAGVIRGDRSRFQLFGDTVNTASRMETTGEPGRIHCTQATADLLKSAGKEHWLTKREDLVEAKGKGLMQTYFVRIESGTYRTVTAQSLDRTVNSIAQECSF